MNYSIHKTDRKLFKKIPDFISELDGLVSHDPHFYKIMLDYFNNSSFVALNDKNEIVGFVFGFASQVEPELFFLWQIGVRNDFQGKGIASKLIEKLIKSAKTLGCQRMRSTVLISNTSSHHLFRRIGFSNISDHFDLKKGKSEEFDTYIIDYYGENEDMIVYEKVFK